MLGRAHTHTHAPTDMHRHARVHSTIMAVATVLDTETNISGNNLEGNDDIKPVALCTRINVDVSAFSHHTAAPVQRINVFSSYRNAALQWTFERPLETTVCKNGRKGRKCYGDGKERRRKI